MVAVYEKNKIPKILLDNIAVLYMVQDVTIKGAQNFFWSKAQKSTRNTRLSLPVNLMISSFYTYTVHKTV